MAQKREKPVKKAEEKADEKVEGKAGEATSRYKGGGGEGGRKPVTFVGYPELVQGTIPLTNRGEQKLRHTAVRLDKCELCAPGGATLTEFVTRIRLPPGQTALVPVAVALDPATPPGTYTAEIVVGDERQPAVFHVAERTSVEVTPSRLIVESNPGASYDKTLFIHNRGNVPVTLGDIGIVLLEDEQVRCRVIRNTATQLQNPDVNATVGALMDNLRKVYEEIPPLKIRTLNKPVTIPPATTVQADIRIQIAESMPKGRECRGSFRIYDDSVSVLLRGHFAQDTPRQEGEGEASR